MSDKKSRNIKADVIRGFAIITVVMGHCIQQGNGLEFYNNSMYWSDKMYQFIYSFHMPLFMLLAGWFVFFSLKKIEGDRKAQWKFIGKRAFMYLFPVFFWTLFEFVRGYLINVKLGNANAPIGELVPQFVTYFLTNLWFLWAVLVCLVIVFVMHFYLKDNVILYAIGFLTLFILPDGMNLGVYKFLMPYYIGAFYANMLKDKIFETTPGQKIKNVYKEKPWMLVLISAVLFAALFALYNERVFIYLSGYRITKGVWIKQIAVDMYRMIIGFAGSAFFILLLDRLVELAGTYRWPVLTAFGKNSLGVYILQGYYILIVMVRFTNDYPPAWWRVGIETVIISAVSLVTAMIIGKIPVLKIIIGKMGK